MEKDYKKIIPLRFQNAEYEDISEDFRKLVLKQVRDRNGVYFFGEPGVGKTHIVCGFIKNFLKNNFEVMFLNTGDFLEKLREEFNKTEYNEEDSIFRTVMNFKGILVFDDIGAEKVSEWTRERLYLIINKKYEDMIPVFFTSNCDMEILSARLGDRITSRIMGMTEIIRISGGDKRKK